MIARLLTTIFAVTALGLTAVGQATFSESKPYKPRPAQKSDKKNKTDKDSAPVSTPIIVPIEEDVTIPISVFTRAGVVVDDLTKENVIVYVNGAEMPVVEFAREKEPPTVVLVMDSSPSAKLSFEKMRERAWTLVQALPADTKVAVLEFDTGLRVLSHATNVRAETRSALAKTQMRDGTSLYSAIATMYSKVLPQIVGRKVVVILTDGVDTTSKTETFASSLVEVEKQDVSTFPIFFDTQKEQLGRSMGNLPPAIQQILITQAGLPGRVGSSDADYKRASEYLSDLSAATGGRVLKSEKLEDSMKGFVSELSSRYYAKIKVQKNGSGSRDIRVRITRPELTVVARGSFMDQ